MCVCMLGEDIILCGLRNHMISVKNGNKYEGIVQTSDIIIAIKRVTES